MVYYRKPGFRHWSFSETQGVKRAGVVRDPGPHMKLIANDDPGKGRKCRHGRYKGYQYKQNDRMSHYSSTPPFLSLLLAVVFIYVLLRQNGLGQN